MSAQKAKPAPAEAAHLNELLDEALEETFPASDPVAIDVKLQPLGDHAPNMHTKLTKGHSRQTAYEVSEKGE